MVQIQLQCTISQYTTIVDIWYDNYIKGSPGWSTTGDLSDDIVTIGSVNTYHGPYDGFNEQDFAIRQEFYCKPSLSIVEAKTLEGSCPNRATIKPRCKARKK